MGFLSRLRVGLAKTRAGLTERVARLVSLHREVDEEFFEELEEILIQADIGVAATARLLEAAREEVRRRKIKEADQVREVLKERMRLLLEGDSSLTYAAAPPTVFLFVGVNGTGKTTTIGKLACRFSREKKKVVLAAADTFRAAAGEQLEAWARRAGAEIIRHQPGADPAAVVFDALQAGKKRGADFVLVDTAGRLHTKTNLMEELRKVRRVIEREVPGAPHEVLLVLDATTGQNGLRQAQLFKEAVGVTGIALAKLDGTAKGGIVFAIKEELGIPVKLVGVGEGAEDLEDFDPTRFVAALFEDEVRNSYKETYHN